jgi:hypothetical protein
VTRIAARENSPPVSAPIAGRPSIASITVDLPPARAAANTTPAAFPSDEGSAAAALASDQGPPMWPWLLAAVTLSAGAAFLFKRRSEREAFAGGPQVNAFTAPEPQRAPPPAPPPPAAAKPLPPAQATGIVSTRLRPWLDVEFEPFRCIVKDERVIFEFELDLLNSGSAPAQDIRVGIDMFNAGPTQDQDLAAFFADPARAADPVPDIQPYKRVELRPQLVVPRERLRILEARGRRFFVPLLAFNVLYGSGRHEAQAAAGFLLGRETKGDKLGTFAIDQGPRVYPNLGTRMLPGNIRR